MRVPEAVLVGLAVIIAAGAALGGLAVLIHSPIQNELVSILLGAALVVVPALLVAWAFHRRRPKSLTSTRVELATSPSPWLEVWDEEEEGYTVVGDARALELLGAQCLRLAAEDEAKLLDDSVNVEIGDVVVKVVRQDTRSVPEPQTWKDKLVGGGCLLLALLLGAIWLRGCVAVESDLERWLK